MKDAFILRQRAYELFEESWDTESVADELKIEYDLAERWESEFLADQALNGLPEDTELAKQLLGVQAKSIALREKELEAYQLEKTEKLLKEKRGKVIIFKKLFNFLKDHCQGYKWNFEEVLLFIKKLKVHQTQIEEVSGHDEAVFEKLFIWNKVQGLIEHLEEIVEDYEDGDTIKFNFDDNTVLFLEEGLEISDFDEEIEEEIEEEASLSGLLEEEFSPKKY